MSQIPSAGPYQPLPPVYLAPQGPRNGLGTASFVLGIIATVLSIVPFLNIIVLVPAGLTGLGVGIGGVYRLSHGTATNKALTWIGVGLSILFFAVFAASLNSTPSS